MKTLLLVIEAIQATLSPIAYGALGIGILIAILFEVKTLIKKIIYEINRRQ